MRKYSFTLFLVFVFVFCGHDLYFWILFQFCGLILYFFWVCSLLGMLISGWGFVFLFSGSSRESPDFSGIPENYSRQKRLYILLILETLGNLPEQENFYGKRLQESSKISNQKN